MTRNKKAATKAATATADPAGQAAVSTSAPTYTRVEWVKRPDLTERLIAYLVDNPPFRIKLFSDSVADAKKEGRAKKTGKEGKLKMYQKLAGAVFIDPQEKAAYDASDKNKKKFGESVGQRLSRLKADYKGYRKELGATGSGILVQTAEVKNRIDEIRAEWPWWDELNAFWCELPNYAPCGVSASEPGAEHAADAAKLFQSTSSRAGLGQEEQDELDDDPAADEDEDTPPSAGGAASDDFDDSSSTHSSRMQSNTRSKSPASDDFYDVDDSSFDTPTTDVPAKRAPLGTPASKPPMRRSEARASAATPAPSSRSSSSAPSAGSRSSSAASRSSSQQPAAKSTKAKLNPLEILRESRLADTERLAVKRRMEHDELMESAKLKRRRMDLEHERATHDREHQAREAQANREHQLELKRIELQILLAQRPAVQPSFAAQQLAPAPVPQVAPQHAPYAGLAALDTEDGFGGHAGAFEGLGGVDPGLGF